MPVKSASHTPQTGLFEPEGIYLAPPLEGPLVVLCAWGENGAEESGARYNGVPLKGHVGIDLAVSPGARLVSTDAGRVVEVAVERGGFERYIKVEHRWGESFYAHVGELLVETGQSVQRGEAIALAFEPVSGAAGQPLFFHFGIRVTPYNRYDGWGGFTDPTPFLPAGSLLGSGEEGAGGGDLPPGRTPLHAMADERQGLRRP